MNFKQQLNNNLKNLIGKSVKQKYIVFESDDWGSIRMPSLEALNRLKTKGLDLESGYSKRYNNTDTLASKQDFEALFETLIKYKDVDGNSPVFTAFSLVANPDFEKIKANGYISYEYEPFTKTLERYGQSEAFAMWQEGIYHKLFIPEFHGREHLNVPVWMRMLQAGDKHTHLAFNEGLWAIRTKTPYNIQYSSAFDVENPDDIETQKKIIKSGLKLFNQIHGYKSKSIFPPNGPFNNKLLKACKESGIKYVGTSKIQKEPQGKGQAKNIYHWLGQKNKHNQIFLTRNAFFEPNEEGIYGVDDCLKNIHYAFKWNKPAVISTHRTNYIGGLDPKNRDQGLKELNDLLTKILKTWPDVRFITSSQLGNILN